VQLQSSYDNKTIDYTLYFLNFSLTFYRFSPTCKTCKKKTPSVTQNKDGVTCNAWFLACKKSLLQAIAKGLLVWHMITATAGQKKWRVLRPNDQDCHWLLNEPTMPLIWVITLIMKKRSEATQTLRAGCSKAEPKFFALPQTPFPIGWRFGVAVTRWSRSTQLLYIEPG